MALYSACILRGVATLRGSLIARPAPLEGAPSGGRRPPPLRIACAYTRSAACFIAAA